MKQSLNVLFQVSICLFTCFQIAQAQCYRDKCTRKKRISLNSKRTYSANQSELKIGTGLLPSFFLDGGIVHFRPVTIGVDYFITKHFSLGGIYGYSLQETNRFYKQIQKEVALKNEHRYYGFRALAHYTQHHNWTFYGGAVFGLNHSNYTATESTGMETSQLMGLLAHRLRIYAKKKTVSFSGLVGASCNLTKRTALWAEIAGSVSLITAGVSLKMF